MAEQSRLEIVVDSRRAEGNVRRVRNELGDMERTGVTALGSLRSAALLATGALAGIGVGVGLGSAISDIREFSTEMSGLRAVSQASAEDMGRLESQARQLGATTAFGANQAAQAQRFLAQAGLEVNEVLGATPAALQLAQAGMLGLGEAADLATDIMQQMGLEVEDLNRINDVLVATSQSATTNVRQLGEGFSYAGPIADQFGVSLEDTAAALGTISSGGVKASRAGTGLLGIFRQLANPTDDAAAALDGYNISLADVDVAARGIGPVIRTLSEASISGADSFKIFGSEAGVAAQALLNGADNFASLREELQTLDGTAADAAKTMTDNLGGAFKGLGSAASEANLQLGDSGLTGGLRAVIDTATGVVQVFNGMQGEWAAANDIGQDFVGTVEGIAAAAELTAVAVGVRLATALGNATSAQVAKTAASVRDARAESVAAQAVTRRTGAELASARAMLSSIRLEEQATRGTAAHAFALNSLSAARVRATAAAGAHNAATAASTAAMGRASIAARGLSGAMALVGGPLGAAVAAGAGIYYFREELGLVPRAAAPASEHLETLADRIDGVTEATVRSEIAGFTAELVKLQTEAAAAEKRLDTLRSTQGESTSFGQGQQGDLRQGIGQAEADLEDVRNEISARQSAIDTLRDGLESTGSAGDSAGDALTNLGKTADDLVEKFRPMLNQDVEDILERAGEGSTIDDKGQIRDAFGNALPSLQRELDAELKDQINAFRSEQNLQAGLEAAAQAFADGAGDAAAQAWNSITPKSADEVAANESDGLVPTGDQDSVPALAGAAERRLAGGVMATGDQTSAPPRWSTDLSGGSGGGNKQLGTLTLKSDEGSVDVEGASDELTKWLADTLSGVAAGS